MMSLCLCLPAKPVFDFSRRATSTTTPVDTSTAPAIKPEVVALVASMPVGESTAVSKPVVDAEGDSDPDGLQNIAEVILRKLRVSSA